MFGNLAVRRARGLFRRAGFAQSSAALSAILTPRMGDHFSMYFIYMPAALTAKSRSELPDLGPCVFGCYSFSSDRFWHFQATRPIAWVGVAKKKKDRAFRPRRDVGSVRRQKPKKPPRLKTRNRRGRKTRSDVSRREGRVRAFAQGRIRCRGPWRAAVGGNLVEYAGLEKAGLSPAKGEAAPTAAALQFAAFGAATTTRKEYHMHAPQSHTPTTYNPTPAIFTVVSNKWRHLQSSGVSGVMIVWPSSSEKNLHC